MVLDPGAGEPDAGLLIEGQSVSPGPRSKNCCHEFFRQECQTEMVGINALLLRQGFHHQMGHELMPCESERDGVARLPTQRTTKSIDIETFRRRHVAVWEKPGERACPSWKLSLNGRLAGPVPPPRSHVGSHMPDGKSPVRRED